MVIGQKSRNLSNAYAANDDVDAVFDSFTSFKRIIDCWLLKMSQMNFEDAHCPDRGKITISTLKELPPNSPPSFIWNMALCLLIKNNLAYGNLANRHLANRHLANRHLVNWLTDI
jgi:hypothetical protein